MPERTDRSRSSPHSNPVRLRFDQFELDEANARLLRGGEAIALAPTPFSVLSALARQPGALFTTNALLDRVCNAPPADSYPTLDDRNHAWPPARLY